MSAIGHHLMKTLSPADLVSAAMGSSQHFLNAYGDAPMLCISLRHGLASELGEGLKACVDPGEGGPAKPGAFHTEVASAAYEEPSRTEADHVLSPRELLSRLNEGPYFALSVIKRARATLSQQRISVGRARNTDVVLRDGNVSKFHAWFELHGDDILLADAGSKNGTLLRGEPMPHRELMKVSYGDPIVFGAVHGFLCEPPALWEAFHLGR